MHYRRGGDCAICGLDACAAYREVYALFRRVPGYVAWRCGRGLLLVSF